ncbi:MAG: hypothetical protein IPH38_15055 [Candidatus Microthrix sp.]|nr:hypothetical protein [Candidatus Microthrix sp.]MBK7020868.1 hypothetical protein [Candidatus Microthrix sp.]
MAASSRPAGAGAGHAGRPARRAAMVLEAPVVPPSTSAFGPSKPPVPPRWCRLIEGDPVTPRVEHGDV